MYFTDWAWRANVRDFRTREGITLLALAYLTDMRTRGGLGPNAWWFSNDMARLTGLSLNRTSVHLKTLHKRGLVEMEHQGQGKPVPWRLPEAVRQQKGAAVPRTRTR